MNEAFEKWIADQDKYNPPTHKEAFRAGMLAAADVLKQQFYKTQDECEQAIREVAK
jgi:hypothetical protein